jgi:LSD1 subclass zinc finger protein
MVFQVHCPQCQNPLRLREEYGGKNVRCPKCQQVFRAPRVPATGEGQPAPASGRPQAARPTVSCPACGAANPPEAQRCQACQQPLGEEAPPTRRPRKRSPGAYKPCPRCGARGARRVTWTFWGSFYGPALFCHVRCPECGYAYNGRTGRSNLLPAIVFVTIPAILLVALVGFIIWIIVQRTSGQ